VAPPALAPEQQAQLKVAILGPPQETGIGVANWNGKVVQQFIRERFDMRLSRSSCLNYLHRLGFVLKRPKKRFLKVDMEARDAFVARYASWWSEARIGGAKLIFADEAHFRADADLRSKWVLRDQPALADSTSPRWGEKASYYSAVCLETGEVEVAELDGNSTAAFLGQLRGHHLGPLVVIWDNGPAHRGEVIRQYLATVGLNLQLVSLPAYSPDFNGDEAIWHWPREEVTTNTCLETKAKVRQKLAEFFNGLAERASEVKRRCRTELQARADALTSQAADSLHQSIHVDPTLVSV